MKLAVFFITTLFIATESFAASKGTGTIIDLRWPAVNFVLLFGTLGFLLRKPVKEMFDKNAEDVTSLFGLAEEKNKEAQIRLDEYNKKMSNLESEKNKILKEAEQNANSFSKEHATETDSLIESLHTDAKSRIESEKVQMGRNLNSGLLDEVISRVKGKISSDKTMQEKATNKLVSQI